MSTPLMDMTIAMVIDHTISSTRESVTHSVVMVVVVSRDITTTSTATDASSVECIGVVTACNTVTRTAVAVRGTVCIAICNGCSSYCMLCMTYVLSITMHATSTSITSTALGAVLVYGLCLVVESSIHPFDILEAEPEIVSGWYVDYGGIAFVVIYLSEGIATIRIPPLVHVGYTNVVDHRHHVSIGNVDD